MKRLYYRWLVTYKSFTYEPRLKEAIDILANEGKCEGYQFYQTLTYGKAVYDIYTDCLHIHISLSDKETIYSVRIKKLGDKWEVKDDDPSHPLNSTYEVFISYMVPVLDVTSAYGSMYKNGAWDESVYRSMENFFKYIDNLKESHKFNESYKKQWSISLKRGGNSTRTKK